MKTLTLTILPHKKIRSLIIKEWLKDKNYLGCVCFSCGNANMALKNAGVNTIGVATNGDLTANRWFLPSEIHQIFANYFDATSGHLPMELMNLIANYYKEHFSYLPNVNYIPSGSGETLVCLKMAFPDKKFIAVYDLDKPTEYDEQCILNGLVKAVADDIIFFKDDYEIKEISYNFK